MLHQTRGIVLHRIKYSDTSLVVHIYTENFGRQVYMVKGARRPKSQMRANLFHPLSLLDMVAYHKASRELHHLREVKRARDMSNIHSNIAKNSIAVFIAEILYKTLREEENNQALFEFLYENITALEQDDENTAWFHIRFLIEYSAFLGFQPSNNYEKHCRFFNLREGVFLHDKSTDCLGEEKSLIWHYLLARDYDSLPDGKIRRMELLNMLIKYYSIHFEGMGTVNSLDVLREVFA